MEFYGFPQIIIIVLKQENPSPPFPPCLYPDNYIYLSNGTLGFFFSFLPNIFFQKSCCRWFSFYAHAGWGGERGGFLFIFLYLFFFYYLHETKLDLLTLITNFFTVHTYVRVVKYIHSSIRMYLTMYNTYIQVERRVKTTRSMYT